MSQQRPEDALGDQNIPPSFAPSSKRNKSANSNSIPSFPPKKAHKKSELKNEAHSAPKIEASEPSNNQRVQRAPSFEPKPRRSSQNVQNYNGQSLHMNQNNVAAPSFVPDRIQKLSLIHI